MEKQRERKDIDVKDTWDLTLIFKTPEEFLQSLKEMQNEIKNIEKFKGHILDNENTLYEFLTYSDELERKIYKLYYYAHLNFDSETTNIKFQEYDGLVENLLQEYSILSSFVTPELMEKDFDLVKEYISKNKKLKNYYHNLESIYRYKEHTLNKDEQRIVSALTKSLGLSEEVFEKLTDSDMTFGEIEVDVKKVELTESNYSLYIRHSDRKVREQAFKGILGTYGKYSNTLASLFQGNVESLVSIAKLEKFKSSLEASLYSDNLDSTIYNTLIRTINENMEVIYKYFKMKKEVLGLDELHMYDIYLPLTKDYNEQYTFERAKETVLEALKPLGEEYIENLKKAFNERWIDIYNNKGKRGGAYSSGFFDTKPYVLLNFEGKYDDVSTLAHELGHSMHTYYSCKNNTYNNSSYNIFVAEVASTVNELLLSNYLIKNAKSLEEKKFLINQQLELYKSTIYRQVMFAEFEKDMHSDYEKGEILTHEYLCTKYYELVKRYFGDGVVVDDLIKNEWMRIPHFYYNFYVYKYAVGLSCATKIVNGILSGNKEARDSYLNFLKTGGSDYPANELLVANVDVLDENLYKEAIQTFDRLIDEYKELEKRR